MQGKGKKATYPRRDHSPDFFYQQTPEKTTYKKNIEPQTTRVEDLAKSARLFHKNGEFIEQKQSTTPQRLRVNSSMNDKFFRVSSIFDGVVPKRQFDQAKPQPIVEDSQFKDGRFSVGAVANKGFNSKVVQNIENKNTIVTLDFKANENIDEQEVKRQLLKSGIQVTSINVGNPLYSGQKQNQGSITVRGNVTHLDHLVDHLDRQGLKASKHNSNNNARTAEKTWIGQKLAYAKIGYFENKKSLKVK